MKTIRNRLEEALHPDPAMSETLRRKKLLDFLLVIVAGMVMFVLIIYWLYLVVYGKLQDPGNEFILTGAPITLVGLILVLLLNQRKGGFWASFLFVCVVFAGCLMDAPAEVAEGRSLLYFAFPIVLSSLVIRPWAGFVTAFFSCIINVTYVALTPDTAINSAALIGFFILAGIMWLATSSLENTIRQLNLANQALRASEENYRTLVEISPDMVMVGGPDGTLELVNPASLEILGCETAADLVGEKIWNFIDATERQSAQERRHQQLLVEARKVSGMEVLVNKKDGSTAYVEIKSSLLNTFAGGPGKVISVGRDVTLRRKEEQKLLDEKDRLEDTVRESEAAYQNLVENSAQGLVLAQAGRIIQTNPALAEICGLPLPGLNKLSFEQLQAMIHPEDRETTLSFVRKCLAEGLLRHYETRLLLADGQVRWVEFTPRQISFMGKPAMQITVIDRTKRKLAEIALAQSVVQLKEMEASLREAKEGLEVRVAERTAELNTRREQLRELTHQIVTVQEDERRRVSRELHDEAGQILIGLKYRLGEALSNLPLEYQEARQRIAMAMNGTDQAMQKIRALAHALRPPTLDVAGVNLSLQSYCQEFSEKISLPVKYKGTELPGLTDEISISLYRILQEGLNNVSRHAFQATRVEVTLRCRKKVITLTIVDNGIGYLPEPERKGIGLLGIQERLNLLGGQLQILPGVPQGTRLQAVIPLPSEKAPAEANGSARLSPC